ncbi:hypothetical protein B0T21DRAFT_385969 [Apiosordaria backusii]|uniref:Uncharacterized protein n=1 Tax=Apiosordaria backusii TaxID=314023 RepID=A0AA40E1P9_9PEZI|nr:hypothetical protein B0T21DRAFT_385969 [Apiosordaria backusii]
MSGRGRGRGRGASSTDSGARRARRSTRQAQQQQESEQAAPTIPPPAAYEPGIDPAISAPQNGMMAPPPPRGAKNTQGPSSLPHLFARRGTRREHSRGGSLASINSVPVSDSVYTAYTSQPDHLSESGGSFGSSLDFEFSFPRLF